ncbi:unnamed protein product, partial [Amoebophrya sp. A25]
PTTASFTTSNTNSAEPGTSRTTPRAELQEMRTRKGDGSLLLSEIGISQMLHGYA